MKQLNQSPVMAIIWSIAFPGFGQIYNQQFLKAILFMVLEFTINLFGHLNQSIIYSFWGEIERSQAVLDYDWILFYPCAYVIPMWDAYAVAYRRTFLTAPPAAKVIPFSLGAMFATIGVIYGSRIFPGPILLPIILIIAGSLLGNWIKLKVSHLEETPHND
jgi:TM2 domain-containing membrane protein YozV